MWHPLGICSQIGNNSRSVARTVPHMRRDTGAKQRNVARTVHKLPECPLRPTDRTGLAIFLSLVALTLSPMMTSKKR